MAHETPTTGGLVLTTEETQKLIKLLNHPEIDKLLAKS